MCEGGYLRNVDMYLVDWLGCGLSFGISVGAYLGGFPKFVRGGLRTNSGPSRNRDSQTFKQP